MTHEQIVNLWKTGYSKMWLYELEYFELKKKNYHKRKIELQYEARRNVNLVIKSEYYGYNFR